jgi:hypothetical protein
LPSDTRNPKLAVYPLRTEAVMTLQGIEGSCEAVFEELLGATAQNGLEPEDDPAAVKVAVGECERIALAADCLRGRLEDEIGGQS